MREDTNRLGFVAARIKDCRRRLLWVVFVAVLLAVSSTYATAEKSVLSEVGAGWAWEIVTPAELEELIARGDVVPTDVIDGEESPFSLLMYAVSFGNNPDLLDVLVKHGADINWSDEGNGYTALHLALSKERVDYVRRLLELGADVNRSTIAREEGESSYSPLTNAAGFSDNPDLLDVLVKHGADINWSDEGNGLTALHFAVYNGQIEKVRRLLELGADVHRQATDGPPIFMALGKRIEDASTRRQLLELLLSYGADLHAEVKSTDKFAVNLLMEAAMNQLKWPDRRESYAGILDYLVEVGIHPDSAPKRNQGATAMYGVIAAADGKSVIEELVRLGADVNARSTTGETPLMFFASGGVSMDVWDALIAHGADIDAMNNGYRSVLYYARERMKGEIDDGYEIFGASPFSSVEEWRAFGGEIVARIELLCEERHYQVCDELEGGVNLKAVLWTTKEVLLQMLTNLLDGDDLP